MPPKKGAKRGRKKKVVEEEETTVELSAEAVPAEVEESDIEPEASVIEPTVIDLDSAESQDAPSKEQEAVPASQESEPVVQEVIDSDPFGKAGLSLTNMDDMESMETDADDGLVFPTAEESNEIIRGNIVDADENAGKDDDDDASGDVGKGDGDIGKGDGDVGKGDGDVGKGNGDVGKEDGDVGKGDGDVGKEDGDIGVDAEGDEDDSDDSSTEQPSEDESKKEMSDSVPEEIKEDVVISDKDDASCKDEQDDKGNEGDEGEDSGSKGGLETETVSEDELPSESIKPPSDTEAVSDEELPPNNAADHLLDTEAVSEDELPPVKKKKIESDGNVKKKDDVKEEETKHKTATKRSASASSESSNAVPTKKAAVESKSTLKALVELDKYWKAVKDDPADFTGWTYLLQYVDQGQDVPAAREAYDAFLSHYPYCYGYWRKYADYEKKKGEKTKSQEVFERGLAAIPLSVDLWLHYLSYIKNNHTDDEDYIREQYNRAIDVCGIEFRSDRLWDSYIKWETECKNINNVFSVYDKLLGVPTQGYKGHFENFVDFVKANQPSKMLGVDEFLSLRAEVLQKLKQKGTTDAAPSANAPPGDDSDEEAEKSPTFADEETKLMRDKIISIRSKTFKNMSNEVLDRWNYEEGIKRPYFHVKPLERCQLNNWRSYLDYEIGQGNKKRTIVLFERCLIACALYDEFWIKYVKHLESLSGDDVTVKIRDVYHRACTIHHPKKPMLSLSWASFEENKCDVEKARQILIRLEKEVPNSLQISISRINLERRANNLEEVSKLYDNYIVNNKNKYATNALSIKYARFCQKILDDVDKGSEVLKKAIEKDKDNPRLHHQLLDLVFSKAPRDVEQEEECVKIIDQFLERESTDIEHKLLFAQHKVEFLEDFGSSVVDVQKAVVDYTNLLKQVKEKRRKQFEEKIKIEEKKVKSENNTSYSNSGNAATNGGSSGGYQQGNYPSGQQPPFQQQNANQYQQPSNYGQPPYNQYNNQSDPNYNNYQNWNYSQTPGYNTGYNQGWGGTGYNYY